MTPTKRQVIEKLYALTLELIVEGAALEAEGFPEEERAGVAKELEDGVIEKFTNRS